MNRTHLVFGACFVALVSSMLACNSSPAAGRGLTLEAIRLTMAAVTPVGTSTLPATKVAGPTSTPFRSERPFPISDSPGAAFDYRTRPGDTLEALATRFGVDPA
jgi:hypothetical protein